MILTRLRLALALATLSAGLSPALASDPYCLGTQCFPTMAVIDPNTGKAVSPAGGGGGSGGSSAPSTGTNAYTPATVSGTSSQVLPSATSRVFLDLKNESAAQPIACAFGGTAGLNTAGSFTIAPGADKVWENSFVPSDQVNCITTAGNTAPLTIGAK